MVHAFFKHPVVSLTIQPWAESVSEVSEQGSAAEQGTDLAAGALLLPVS